MTLPDAPRPGRMERKKEETQRKILAAALNLFRTQGFDATPMEQIAAEADIAKGTLYNYFPVKEAILDEYIRRSFREKNEARTAHLSSLPGTRARLTFIFTELVSGVQAQREIFEKFMLYHMKNVLSLHKNEGDRVGVERLSTEIIRLGLASGELRDDLPPGLLEDLFDFVFIEIVKQLSVPGQILSAEEIIERCIDLFMSGAARPAR